MTITYIEEVASGRTAKNTKGIRTYQAQFRLSTSEQTERAYHVGSHPYLPVIGSEHPDDPDAYCVDISVDPTGPWKIWTVTANYTTEREVTLNPLSEPAVIVWGSEQFQKPSVIDKDGHLIVNSAGDPFDPPAMMDDARVSVTVTKNVSSIPSWILSYHNTVNSDSFTIDGVSVAAGKAKIQAVSCGERQSRAGVSFRVVSFSMTFRYEGWKLEPLDAGMRKISGSTRVAIANADAPVPLDGTGQPIPEPTYLNAVYGTFSVYRTTTFASLPLT
jgi:hypothetical protein